VATYQNLGYWKNNIFTVLSPVRKVEQYQVKHKGNYQFELMPLNQTDSVSLNQAISNYQTIGYKPK
jgi:hypothetical protein